jgi:hypothetical protein
VTAQQAWQSPSLRDDQNQLTLYASGAASMTEQATRIKKILIEA